MNKLIPIKRVSHFTLGCHDYIHFMQGTKTWYRHDDNVRFTSKEITRAQYFSKIRLAMLNNISIQFPNHSSPYKPLLNSNTDFSIIRTTGKETA